ncbi:putative ribonuclease H-like domain-containing protein [Tanacetum coccineum]|uniref:Ribonuclease H-like domain-containing protein n=1 Tax=Tanacetum coccineum TaxID=301880 RepID=A0ABQ4XZG4_9ASTR
MSFLISLSFSLFSKIWPAVLTRTGKIQVNTTRTSGTNTVNTARTSGTNIVNAARHNFNRRAVPTNDARKVNIGKPIVNNARPKAGFHKTLSPFRKPFNRTTTLRPNFSYQKVNTVENKGIVDSGCSRHMTGNKAYLAEYQDFNGGPVAFRGSKGYITGKGKIKIGKLDFKDVCFVKELQHFNLFYVSQMCDKKNKILFTDTECLVLSPEFKLPDENQVLLRIPRQNNMYSFNLENIVPSGGLACLIAKATIDESNKWHRRLGHVNFKNLNKLVKGNLIRGLPSKGNFSKYHTCVFALSKESNTRPPVKANQFSWVFFLRTKDETSGILKDFIRQIENQLNQKVKTIRCDNGTEFKNRDFIEFCGSKGIKREYSNARTPQQNGVAKRKNKTLIEAARTMLADSFLPNTFWAEAVSTACYVLNRVLVTKPQNKTPYELITGKIPIISYIRPFGCHVTILNTIDHLGKFDGKSDEGFLVGYSLNSKAFRVYNLETKRVEENLHITFLENKPNVAGKGPNWLFDLDYLTDSMNYQPVRSENQANKHAGPKEANHSAGTQDNIDAGNSEMEAESAQDYFVLPIWSSYTSTVKSSEAKNEGQICDNKCKVIFSKHDSEITKDEKVIGSGIRKSGLYVMKLGKKPKDKICLTTIVENSTLWHMRLGHANMRLIQLLSSKELVRNVPKLKFDQHFCDAYKIGKKAHFSHKAKNIVSTTRRLELLHMDLFGPSAARSYGGNLYTLVIVDEYSRYTWTRFLKNKTEAFEQFEIFSRKIQNQLVCNANSITHNFSAPRTPQSNGMVERKNRTLQEMSRTMSNEQSLPQKFWCNAVDTSTYILNRILIRAILGKNPYDLLRGRKPTLDYFKGFGSKCFILNTKYYLTKFDPKSYEGVFLEYSQNSKTYIILNKHTTKIKESLNVTFNETPPPSKTSPLVDDDLDEEAFH